MILDKKVKSQGVGEEKHDFIIGTPSYEVNHYAAIHPNHMRASTFQNHVSFP